MQTLKAEVGIQLRLIIESRDVRMLKLELLTLLDHSVGANCRGLTVLKTRDKRMLVDFLLEVLELDLSNIMCVKVLVQDFFHLVALLQIILRLLLALLFLE